MLPNRRRAGGATARRRRRDALSRLVRSRSAERKLTEIDAVEALESFRRDTGFLRTFRFRPLRAPARTAPSCTTASAARAIAASRPANCF